MSFVNIPASCRGTVPRIQPTSSETCPLQSLPSVASGSSASSISSKSGSRKLFFEGRSKERLLQEFKCCTESEPFVCTPTATLTPVSKITAEKANKLMQEKAEFQKLASEGFNLVPVVHKIFSDQLTPVLAYRRLVPVDDFQRPSFLLESVLNSAQHGRFSFVGSDPAVELLAKERTVTILRHRRKEEGAGHDSDYESTSMENIESDDPLQMTKKLSQGWRAAVHAPSLPEAFCGGWVGYVGYDSVRYVEPKKCPFSSAPEDDRNLLDIHLCLYRQMIIFDHITKVAYVVSWIPIDEYPSLDHAFDAGKAELRRLEDRLNGATPDTAHVYLPPATVELSTSAGTTEKMTCNMTKEQFLAAVDKAKYHIGVGDAFQIVLSQRFERKTRASPFEIYRALRIVNPSPYMFYMQCRGCVLAASSPEILTRLHRRVITNRPLAGTRRRGADAAEDDRLEEELLRDEKELAEHRMLVDLGRNDVGKVAEIGTVRVPKLMNVERYSHVMHISSTVTGELLPHLDHWDALRSGLPAGTVSGAPKVRAIQIIDSLEPTRRGPYGGGAGVAGFDGNMDMALALRTMVIPTPPPEHKDGEEQLWTVHLQAGAGLVADSVPESEYMETVNKSAALARAIDLAEDAFHH